MSREPNHPAAGAISLSAVYDALSEPVRRTIVTQLADRGELNCSDFLVHGSKTSISYHLARLREAGITHTRIEGKLHFINLREADLEKRFPGLLPAVIASVRIEARSAGKRNPVKAAAASPAAKASSVRKAAGRKTTPA